MESNDNRDQMPSLVLVTGANGFIAAWVVYQLMLKGYNVRGTVRDVNDKKKIAHLIALPMAKDKLELVNLDMVESTQEEFNKVVDGCQYVIHVASPVVVGDAIKPKDQERLVIRPAVDGTLKMLRACTNAGTVKRFVYTTSIVAFDPFYGGDNVGIDPTQTRTVHPTDWTDLNKKITSPYTRSKTLAEKAAWDYVKENKSTFDMVSIGPPYVLGPTLSAEPTIGNKTMEICMTKNVPFMIDFSLCMVDVRDCAECHIRAMEVPEAGGQRFLIGAGRFSILDTTKVAGNLYNSMGYSFPAKKMSETLYKFIGLFDADSAAGGKLLGNNIEVDVETSVTVLGMKYKSLEETILALCDTLVYHRRVPKSKLYQQRWHLPNEIIKEDSNDITEENASKGEYSSQMNTYILAVIPLLLSIIIYKFAN